MILLMFMALFGMAGQAAAAGSTCVAVPGSIPAGSVRLETVLEKAAGEVGRPEDLAEAAFGLG